MRNLTRALILGGLCLVVVTAAQAQTIERYAGGARLVNSPGLQTPLIPGEIALAPDGRLFVMHDADGAFTASIPRPGRPP